MKEFFCFTVTARVAQHAPSLQEATRLRIPREKKLAYQTTMSTILSTPFNITAGTSTAHSEVRTLTNPRDLNEARAGIERAFDVIRNHTVHTKGYVMTALQMIEEFGDINDKRALKRLLWEKQQNNTATV